LSPRAKLLALMAIFILPTVASFVVFHFFPPSDTGNYGRLIVPVIALPAVEHRRLDPSSQAAVDALRGKWLVVTFDRAACEAGCRQKLVLMRQTRLMLGREQDRVVRVVLADSNEAPPAEVVREFSGTVWIGARDSPWAAALPKGAADPHDRIYLVDPLGNAFMVYDDAARLEPAKFLKDLKRVLKASQIG
jgi:cytochrome oxidase Cu insertion factor (SCO1/SenC/PrrC family)